MVTVIQGCGGSRSITVLGHGHCGHRTHGTEGEQNDDALHGDDVSGFLGTSHSKDQSLDWKDWKDVLGSGGCWATEATVTLILILANR